MATLSSSNLTVPNNHCNVLYRQTYNSLGQITAAGLTQLNNVTYLQQSANPRLTNCNKGILAGSVVAAAGEGYIGACAGDSTAATPVFDKAVGIAVNDAVGNPYESSSAVASNEVVYAHGSGTVISTDIYEYYLSNGSSPVTYAYGDKLYASRNGLLTNAGGMDSTAANFGVTNTVVGILLKKPTTTDPFMTVQLRI